MRILLTESDRGAADRVARDLAEAGYDVVRCQRSGDPVDECVFFRGQSMCPLSLAPVDAALDVRHPDSGPATVRELGALCAARHDIPLLVTGPLSASGYPWGHAISCEPHGVVETLDELFAPADAVVGRAVARAARQTLRADGVEAEPLVAVAHVAGDTGVFVSVPAPMSAEVVDDVSESVRHAVRGWREFPEGARVVVAESD